jgi:hypothetical protein
MTLTPAFGNGGPVHPAVTSAGESVRLKRPMRHKPPLRGERGVLSPLFYQDDQISFFPTPLGWSVGRAGK